jgi:hypothetical protein
MKTSLVLPFLSLLPLTAVAQPLPAVPPAVVVASNSAADAAWRALAGVGQLGPVASVSGAKGAKPTRAEQAADFVAQADRLKTFQTSYPAHAAVPVARQRETVALAHAALHGERNLEARRQALLAEVRRDPRLTAPERCEAVAWSTRAETPARAPAATREDLIAAEEALTRALIAEFPQVADAYHSLVALARDNPGPRGSGIARELLAMPGAGPEVKAEAQRILDRFDLVGRSAATLFGSVGRQDLLAATTGKPIVVYAWSRSAPGFLRRVAALAHATPGCAFIGICLDSDTAGAGRMAAELSAPGRLHFDGRGKNGALASVLKLGGSLTLYLTDRSGVIRDVHGDDKFATKIVTLSR